MESMMDAEHNSMHAFGTEPSTSVFRSTPNADPKRIHKIDKIKQKLVDMLREIGFKLSNGRLPWSTLEGDLCKKGYTILNWPHGVVRDRDKGISGLSAEDTDRLHDALFVDEQHIQFIPCGEELLNRPSEPASSSDGATSLVVALGTDRPRDSGRSTTGKQQRFKLCTEQDTFNAGVLTRKRALFSGYITSRDLERKHLSSIGTTPAWYTTWKEAADGYEGVTRTRRSPQPVQEPIRSLTNRTREIGPA
ncbi:hypothetical protein L210DRAFT_3627943, partial [Boletus edulis BED1]